MVVLFKKILGDSLELTRPYGQITWRQMMKRNHAQEVPLVIVIDERGARCMDGVPKGLEGYTIERGVREVIVYRKITAEKITVVDAFASYAVVDSEEKLIPSRFMGVDGPKPSRNYAEKSEGGKMRRTQQSRLRQQNKRQLPKRTDAARFNFARYSESLAEMLMS